jgi:hypothetical protein
LDVDDGFGARQTPREAGIVLLKPGQFACQRSGVSGFGAALNPSLTPRTPFPVTTLEIPCK